MTRLLRAYRLSVLAFTACLTILLPPRTFAEPVADPTVPSTPTINPSEASTDGTAQKTGRGVTPVFAPIPFKNTQLGWGLMGMVGLIHHFDADTTIKPSTGAIAGFYSENKSWGVLALEMARLSRDTWRLRGLFSHSEIRYDFPEMLVVRSDSISQ